MATTTELQPIDRLEEKVKQLVGMIESLRTDRTKALDAAARLERDLAAPTTRITELEPHTAEPAALREEREKIRHRVEDIFAHHDSLTP